MSAIFNVSLVLLAGLVISGLLKKTKLPEVTGYLLTGILIGPSILKLITFSDIDNLSLFSVAALAYISFLIGAEFKFKYIKKLGSRPFVIGITTSISTLIVVSVSLLLFKVELPIALILGAIAASTAAAAIMMIIKEYKSKGEMTSNIVSIIGVNDVISIVIFGFTIIIAKYLNGDTVTTIGFLEPFREIFISLILGFSFGLLLGISARWVKNSSSVISFMLAYIFLLIIVCDYYAISTLLSCMVMGATFVNLFNSRITNKTLDLINYIASPLMVIFFVISGASLDISVLPGIATILVVYIMSRLIGKMLGSFIGNEITNSSIHMKKYLGLTLLSQTGLAIGLAITAYEVLGEDFKIIVSIIIASSFVFDLICPILTKKVLVEAGEINEENKS